jgi:putative CocE/NonD family hydrolase
LNDYYEKMHAPVITVSGWYDIFINQALQYHSNAIKNNKENQYLIVGPWGHAPNYATGERDYGDSYTLPLQELEIAWFDHWLKDQPMNIDSLAAIKIFVMGINEWREEKTWPLERIQYVNFYLSSAKGANSLTGDGKLSSKISGVNRVDKFIYDPDDPVPTLGGQILYDEFGAFDQREVEQREDVLVYTSDILKTELEVTGPVKVVLYASTDGPDTDWTAKLLDVYPDGRAFNLCEGIIRARYNKNRSNPVLIKPNKIDKYEIDLWATSNVFLPGHRIRVEISSSNFPRFDRNPNTGNTFGMDSELRIAHQKVYHSKEYPSHIILPIIPKE